MLGEKGGPEIRNRKTILQEVDKLVGNGSPPALEYLFCENAMTENCAGFNLARFGYDY
jgi:hypothetical protein